MCSSDLNYVTSINTASGTASLNNYQITTNYNAVSGSAQNIANINQLNSVAWVGGNSGNWSDANNWANGAIPTAANVANVVIPTSSNVSYDTSGLSASVSITNNGSLSFFTNSSLSFANNISGKGSVIKENFSALTLSGNNSYLYGLAMNVNRSGFGDNVTQPPRLVQAKFPTREDVIAFTLASVEDKTDIFQEKYL